MSRPWTDAEIQLAGTKPEAEVGRLIGRPGKAVWAKRHRVSYRPDSSSPPDYLICSQAGFILRLFDTPVEKRFDFASSPEGDAAVERLVKAHPTGRVLPPQAVPQRCQFLRDALLNHLRSIPVGMRVDPWPATEFPALAELQKASFLRQLQDSVTTLEPQHRQSSPQKIYAAIEAISAAFAAYWTGRLNQPQLALLFKAFEQPPGGSPRPLQSWAGPGKGVKRVEKGRSRMALS